MLKVEGVSKQFSDCSINDISFSVNQDDYFMLLGPSGAGKSVILEIIAGLVKPDRGQVFIDNVDITHFSIGKRNVGLVFQDLAVFPHMTVSDNIGFPLRRKGVKGEAVKKNIRDISEKFSIAHLLERSPATLSGGELQRVALARTLALNPKILLLDEPLSSTDVQLRSGLKALLRNLNREGQTIIHVTHDYDEAISLGSYVAVVNNGSIVQMGTPVEVFRNPSSKFVAHFGGIKNFYQGAITEKTEHDLRCFTSNNVKLWLYTDDGESDGFVCFSENAVTISLSKPVSSAINTFKGVVVDIFQQKHGFEILVDVGINVAVMVTWESVDQLELRTGKEVWVSVKANAVRFISKA